MVYVILALWEAHSVLGQPLVIMLLTKLASIIDKGLTLPLTRHSQQSSPIYTFYYLATHSLQYMCWHLLHAFTSKGLTIFKQFLHLMVSHKSGSQNMESFNSYKGCMSYISWRKELSAFLMSVCLLSRMSWGSYFISSIN